MRLVRCMRVIGVAAMVAGLAAANHSAEAAANEPVEDACTTWAGDVPAKVLEIQQFENADVSALQFGNLESVGGLPQVGGVAYGRVAAENLTFWKANCGSMDAATFRIARPRRAASRDALSNH